MIPENVRKIIKKGEIIIFGTASKNNIPNLIAVECCGLFEDKILIAYCQFNKTLLNLKENNQVSVLASNKKEYFQLKGTAGYFNSCEWFDKVKKINELTEYKPKGAVVVTINETYDLNKCVKLS